MDMSEVMTFEDFAVVGDTVKPEKFACRIKNAMTEHGYNVYAVGKELPSLNDVPGDIDVIDLCINPARGLELLRECRKPFKCVVVQPGAGSEELLGYMKQKGIPYVEDCLLVGIRTYVDSGFVIE